MAKKILIIEDDRDLRELIVKKLKKEKFEVTEAGDSKEGFEKMKKEKPDLILLDLILPGTDDGYTVLSRIKADLEVSYIPVIILSNLGQIQEIQKALKLGAVDYLIKAYFTPTEIIEKIRAAIK